MKNKLTYSLLLAAASCGVALGQTTTAYTTPVGYLTIPLAAGGTTASPKLQIAAQGLLPGDAVQFAGVAESFGTDGTGTFLQDDQGTWAAGSYIDSTETPALLTHLVEILDGPLTGTLTWITGTAPNKIYTYDNVSAAGANAKFRVIKAFTVSSLFGAVPETTALGGGANIGAADNLLIFNSTANTYTTYWYKSSGPGGTGWRSSATSSTTAPAKTAIHPNDSGLVIQRKQATAGSLVISGTVKTGVTDVVVQGGTGLVLNILSPSIPVNQLTLGTSGLYTGSNTTGLLGGANIGSADNVLLFNEATNSYTTFYYKSSGPGGTGWRSSDLTILDPSTYVLPSKSAILIQRKNGSDFIWEMPAVQIGN